MRKLGATTPSRILAGVDKKGNNSVVPTSSSHRISKLRLRHGNPACSVYLTSSVVTGSVTGAGPMAISTVTPKLLVQSTQAHATVTLSTAPKTRHIAIKSPTRIIQRGLTVELCCGPAAPTRTNNRHCTGLTVSAAQRAARSACGGQRVVRRLRRIPLSAPTFWERKYMPRRLPILRP